MAKVRAVFTCQQCGAQSPKWLGKCPDCGAWNSMVEEVTQAPTSGSGRAARSPEPMPITQVPLVEGEVRLRIGIGELDRVLGGGLVTGSLTLLGGDPGVGKSTLLLMALERFGRKGLPTLYVSAEESARQVRLRAERLGVASDQLFLLAETDLDAALAAAEKMRPKVLVLDSVQTLHSPALDGVPGSVGQVREVANRAMRLAKSKDMATFLVGHVTKEGAVAGPRLLEHLVDTVLYFEGEGAGQMRVLRANKNRFGSTGELGFFEMADGGLREVPDASARLLSQRVAQAAGTAVTCAIEGSRPVLAEVQALVGRPTPATPGRTVLGLERGRLSMMLAVLGKTGLHLDDRDVFASAAGGIRLNEPAADLALAAAIASSLMDRAVDPHAALVGEVGLVGEIRSVDQPGARLAEAARHGFARVIGPPGMAAHAPPRLEVIECRTLREALGRLFPRGERGGVGG